MPFGRFGLGLPASGTRYNPSNLFGASDTGDWWDPYDLATMWQDSAGTTAAAVDQPVGKIVGKKNSIALTQATAGQRPILRNSGALWWLEFDGTDDFLSGLYTTANPVTLIAGIQQVTWTINDYLFNDPTNINSFNIYQSTSTPRIGMYSGAQINNDDLSVGVDHVLTAIFNGVSSKIAVDNNAYVTGNTGSGALTGLRIGANSSGTATGNLYFYGGISSGRVLTTDEIAKCRKFFGAKVGLRL